MRSVISKDGTHIAFDQSGRGPALILVAGASATRMDEASVAAALAPYFTVFAYDRRARGDSGDTPPYAVPREVEDIEALIDDSRPSAPADFVSHLNELVSFNRRGEAVELFMTFVGTPAEMIAQMRQSPMWPRMEADAQSFVYDATIVADTERGDPSALKKWESTTVPTLVSIEP